MPRDSRMKLASVGINKVSVKISVLIAGLRRAEMWRGRFRHEADFIHPRLIDRELELAHDFAQLLQGHFGRALTAQNDKVIGLAWSDTGQSKQVLLDKLGGRHLFFQHTNARIQVVQGSQQGQLILRALGLLITPIGVG